MLFPLLFLSELENFKPEKDSEREGKKEAGSKEHIVDLLLYIRRRARLLRHYQFYCAAAFDE